jgi:hypothetical protein
MYVYTHMYICIHTFLLEVLSLSPEKTIYPTILT